MSPTPPEAPRGRALRSKSPCQQGHGYSHTLAKAPFLQKPAQTGPASTPWAALSSVFLSCWVLTGCGRASAHRALCMCPGEGMWAPGCVRVWGKRHEDRPVPGVPQITRHPVRGPPPATPRATRALGVCPIDWKLRRAMLSFTLIMD